VNSELSTATADIVDRASEQAPWICAVKNLRGPTGLVCSARAPERFDLQCVAFFRKDSVWKTAAMHIDGLERSGRLALEQEGARPVE
jgi:hypothetical protein